MMLLDLYLSQKDQKGERPRRGLRRECFDDRRGKNRASKQLTASGTRPWPSRRTAWGNFHSAEANQSYPDSSRPKDHLSRGPPPSGLRTGDSGVSVKNI